MWIDTCAAEGLCRSTRWPQLILQEVAQGGVETASSCIGSTCSEGECADRILRDQIVLQLAANVEANTHGVTALLPADRVLELIEVFTASLREVLIRTKIPIAHTVHTSHIGEKDRPKSVERVGKCLGGRCKGKVDAGLRNAELVQKMRGEDVGPGAFTQLRRTALLCIKSDKGAGAVSEVGVRRSTSVKITRRERVFFPRRVVDLVLP